MQAWGTVSILLVGSWDEQLHGLAHYSLGVFWGVFVDTLLRKQRTIVHTSWGSDSLLWHWPGLIHNNNTPQCIHLLICNWNVTTLTNLSHVFVVCWLQKVRRQTKMSRTACLARELWNNMAGVYLLNCDGLVQVPSALQAKSPRYIRTGSLKPNCLHCHPVSLSVFCLDSVLISSGKHPFLLSVSFSISLHCEEACEEFLVLLFLSRLHKNSRDWFQGFRFCG